MIAKKILPIKYNYAPLICSNGQFAKYDITAGRNSSGSHTCRETFESSTASKSKYISFCLKTPRIKLLNEFFKFIEDSLELRNRSIFYNTKHNNTLVVQPSKFWLQNNLTRGFFTLFLRCGAVYYEGDFDAALRKYNLANSIRPAIYRFIKGDFKLNQRISSGSIVEDLSNAIKQKDLNRYLLDDKQNSLESVMTSIDILKH